MYFPLCAFFFCIFHLKHVPVFFCSYSKKVKSLHVLHRKDKNYTPVILIEKEKRKKNYFVSIQQLQLP